MWRKKKPVHKYNKDRIIYSLKKKQLAFDFQKFKGK